jgi:tetratricopeptide (TPR) repeat protein
VVAFYVISRYRMPVIPVLLVFAGAAVDRFLSDVREGGLRKGWRWVAAVLLLGLIVNIPLPFADVRMDQAHIQLGELYVRLGEDDLARVEFEEALRLEPESTAALASLGQIHLRQGELEKAEEMFWHWSELKPDRGEPLYNLGLVHQQGGNLVGAQAQYFHALEEDPTFLPAYRNLAIVLDELDKVDGAVQILQTALDRVDPKWAEGQFTLGVIWEGREKYERALAAYDLAREMGYPHHGPLHMRLAFCHASLGNVERALEELQSLERSGYRPDKKGLQRILDLLPLGAPR